MSIQRLHIEGFKSLKDVTWELGALNVVIGPNGSGKSNLLKALLFLSASAQGRLKDFILELGGIDSVAWDGRTEGVGTALTLEFKGAKGPYQVTYEIFIRSARTPGGYVFGRELMTILGKIGEEEFINSYIDRTPEWLSLRDQEEDIRELDISVVPINETILSYFKGAVVSNVANEVQEKLVSWGILDDVHTEQTAPMRQPAIARFEERFDSNGQNLIPVLHTLYVGDRDFKQSLDTAMTAAFGDDYRELIFPPASSQRIELQVRWNSLRREQPAAVLSDGTLRFLFLIAALAHPNPPPLIAIDEPETGLHPRMLPIIAEYAAEASKKTQVIFTTHSPQLLDAFHDAKPTTTVATWEDGQTKLATLDGDELDYWLREYTLGSLFTSGELENMAADIREKQMQAQA